MRDAARCVINAGNRDVATARVRRSLQRRLRYDAGAPATRMPTR
jgi:hypothetical protein